MPTFTRYKLEVWSTGYLEGSAVPMQAAKVHQLVDYLDSQLAQSKSGLQQLLLERDIVLVLLMWETPMHGNNHGKLTWKP